MTAPLKVFISSTAQDLHPFRDATFNVVQDLGWHPVGLEHKGTDPRPTVKACLAWVEECDVVLFIQAWRRGWVPTREEDGDGETSITGLELSEAKRLDKPVLAFLADRKWPRDLCDLDAGAIAWVEKFRGEINRPAVFFHHEEPPHVSFRALVRQELVKQLQRTLPGADPAAAEADAASVAAAAKIGLRPAQPLKLPPEPYPLLAPYSHPATFAGRELEIDELLALLGQERLIVTLHAPSGAGKSSLLLAGLKPRLAVAGIPVSLERRPAEPGLARRLIADLLELPEGVGVSDQAPDEFARWLLRAREKSGKPPVLVLDQFEDTLRDPSTRAGALARLGPLLAATAQRLPGLTDPVCRWVLAYRHEFHGEVREWLADVLGEARRADREGLDALPYDLSGEDRARDWPLPVLGKAKGRDASASARRSFLEAIQRPLSVEEPAGVPKYPLAFAAGGAERLAEAFAATRLRQPEAPLVPELQVVLAYLIANATEGSAGRKSIAVPEDETQLEAMIGSALEDHLRRALTDAFPAGRDAESARRGRARALLALRELADAHGRRGEGLAEEALLRILGEGGQAVLEKLASPGVRLILREERDGVYVWVLSHDRMAEVVTRLVEDDGKRGGLEIASDLVAMRRFVRMRSDLFAAGDRASADLDDETYPRVEAAVDALLLDEGRRKWWAECEKSRARRDEELVHQLKSTDVQRVYRTTIHLLRAGRRDPWRELIQARGEEEELRHLLIEGFWDRVGIPPAEPNRALDFLELVPADVLRSRANFGAVIAAINDVSRRGSGELRPRVRDVRDRVRAKFALVLPLPGLEDVGHLNRLIELSGGDFTMGSPNGNESPPHPVRVSRFAIQQHPVTVAEYQRFATAPAERAPKGKLPVRFVSWYQAIAYAAWLGLELPTEAQWEFAARGSEGREYPWGDSKPTKELADFGKSYEKGPDPVMAHPKGATPDGVHDLAGTVWEWCHDWYGSYADGLQVDPTGPDEGPARVLRGGAFNDNPSYLRGAFRDDDHPGHRDASVGFRCVRGGS